MKKIVIIGGGASGIFAGIIAARLGADVTIIEHTDKLGKKLSITGNGKCNFTNTAIEPGDYYGNHPALVRSVFEKCSVEKTLEIFEEMGLEWYKQDDGLVYPLCNQASTVVDVLLTYAQKLKIKTLLSHKVFEIICNPSNKLNNASFIIKTLKGNIHADRLIIACGSKAYPNTGSDGSGYELARCFGHNIIKPLPSLVQLRSSEHIFKEIAGVRSDCEIRLFVETKTKDGIKKSLIASEIGEVQFNDYGISGIPTFQISRYAVKALDEGKKATIVCDFFPTYREEALQAYFFNKLEHFPEINMEKLFLGLLNKKLNNALIKEMGYSLNTKVSASNSRKPLDRQIKKMCRILKNWEIPLDGYNSFLHGQVCQGGVDTLELTNNLESIKQPGLYFAGEIIDIEGPCGGYNLQWAWSSAYVAASNAAQREI